VVQAFESGSEGTVNLTLAGLSETILEICDNGIDDDGDGPLTATTSSARRSDLREAVV